MTLLLLFGSSGGGGSVTQTVTVQAQASMISVSLRLRSQSTGAIVDTEAASETAAGSGVYTADFTDVAAGTYFVQLIRDSDSAIIRFADATLTLSTDTFPVAGVGGPSELDSLYGELVGPPAAMSSLRDKLTWLFMWSRNRSNQTATQRKLYADDAATVVSTEAVSDNGTTFEKGEAS